MDAVLAGREISVAYQQNMIIPPMDVKIEKECITSIIGPNGCGKSTLLKALSRTLPIRSGQVLLDGRMIAHMPTAEVAKQMAILPQGPQAPAGLTVEELVSYGDIPSKASEGLMGGPGSHPLGSAHHPYGGTRRENIDALSEASAKGHGYGAGTHRLSF
ncbi:MAG: ATP-binding cassette domain-containing protein [Eisenbergiella massiliensis]